MNASYVSKTKSDRKMTDDDTKATEYDKYIYTSLYI